jgi:DNA-binding transcriptional ArsR family regulator
VGVAASSVSQHTTVLRDAGLISTQRLGKGVIHTLTPLARALLNSDAADPRAIR